MTGAPDSLPLIADCERALGRPERAVALGRDPAVERLDPAGRAEMSIVGRRRAPRPRPARRRPRRARGGRPAYPVARRVGRAPALRLRRRPGGGRPGRRRRWSGSTGPPASTGRATPTRSSGPRRCRRARRVGHGPQPASVGVVHRPRVAVVHSRRPPAPPSASDQSAVGGAADAAAATAQPRRPRQMTRPPDEDAHVNQVRLRGRVSAAPEQRELPSGDRLVTARLVVARPPGPARQRQPVDVLDCVAWTARAQRLVAGWQPGSVVEVEGAIRRRFRRGTGRVSSSRVEIEVARRPPGAGRAAPTGGSGPARSRRRA